MISLTSSDVFNPGYPIAPDLRVDITKAGDIHLIMMIISRHMGPAQNLTLLIRPTYNDFHSIPWMMLDALLFSWYILKRGLNSPGLSLSLAVSPPFQIKGWTIKRTTKDGRYSQLRDLFPLNMIVGKDRWLGDCNEISCEH